MTKSSSQVLSDASHQSPVRVNRGAGRSLRKPSRAIRTGKNSSVRKSVRTTGWMNMSDLILIVAGSAIVISAALGVVVLLLRRQLERSSAQIAELRSQLEWMRQSISGLTSGAVGVDRRVQHLEDSARTLSERQETYDNQQAEERPYGHAIRLVQQGAGINRLIQELDLSESEADLIVRLHGHRDSA